MKIFAFVGHSKSGKTQLLQRLIPELKNRGYSLAVIKHCAHGFSLDREGKDSWKFMQKGSDGIALISPEQLAVLHKINKKEDIHDLGKKYFSTLDYILIEGGRKDENLRKIEVLRKGIAEKVKTPQEELIAVVSEMDVNIKRPIFRPDQIKEIADFLEKGFESREARVNLEIDGALVPLNAFVQNIFEHIVLGMVSSLKGFRKDAQHIKLSVIRKEK